MPNAAIYARYSTHQQRETSIEDQVRRCTELARRHGYEVKPDLVFSDAAISGKDEALDKRAGYHDLLRAWDARDFDAVVVDELSRLTRGGIELALLHERVDRSRVRLITADGIDSSQPSWSLVFNVQGAVAQQARRETRHRVVRGMLGQLERGYMIADAPFGYRAVVDCGPDGKPIGTRWEVEDGEAAIVRTMYRMRRDGASYMAIARWLNRQGVPPPRKARRAGQKPFWRQSSVHRLLRNRIYAGQFVWQGSAFVRAKAQAEGRTLEPKVFARPHLRLVEDETFCIVTRTTDRPHRGGCKRRFAGLLTCGACDGRLTLRANRIGSQYAYCASCSAAARAGAPSKYMGSVAAEAIRQALVFALGQLFGDDAAREFRQRLRRKLEGDHSAEVLRLEQAVAQAKRACARLSKLLAELPAHSPELERQFRRTFEEQCDFERRLALARQARLSQRQREEIERQLSVDPRSLFDRILDGGSDIQRANAVLRRLFPRIVLVAKPARYRSTVEVEAVAGVGYAEASDGAIVNDDRVVLRLEVACSAHRPVRWHVRVVSEERGSMRQ